MAESEEVRPEGEVQVPISESREATRGRRRRAARLKPGQVPPDTPLEIIKRKAREKRAAGRGWNGVGGSYRIVDGRREPA